MDELRKNQNVVIETSNKTQIKGVIFDFSFDRVLIEIEPEFIQEAKKIRELQELNVTVDTHLGLKKMTSCTISALNNENKILIENNPAYIVITKREYSRVKTEIDFKIKQNKKTYNAKSVNISGNGIAFNCSDHDFKTDEIIEINLNIEEKDIKIIATVIKTKDNFCTAKYTTIDPKDQDKIIRYVFKQSTKN